MNETSVVLKYELASFLWALWAAASWLVAAGSKLQKLSQFSGDGNPPRCGHSHWQRRLSALGCCWLVGCSWRGAAGNVATSFRNRWEKPVLEKERKRERERERKREKESCGGV